jgi:hypothetical protein
MTRVVVAVFALLIAAAAGAFLLRAFGGQGSVPAGERYVDDGGWSVVVPEGWSALPVDEPDRADAGVLGDFGRIWLVNGPAAGLDRGAIETIDDLREALPTDGLVVAVNPNWAMLGYSDQDDSGMPPTLGPPEFEGADGYATWQANTIMFEALAWSGDDVSTEDRRAADDALSSFAMDPLPTPAEGGATPYSRFVFAIGPQERFPTGSVTRIESDDPELPGAFFVVVNQDGTRVAFDAEVDRGPSCDLTWDGTSFACPDGRTWDRDGRSGEGPNGGLRPMPVVRAWDGQLAINLPAWA